MCGIAGYIDFGKSEGVKALAERMLGLIDHRGPDARGIFAEKNIALGSTRLSIIDLGARSNMPLVSDDGNHILVYNGETYNFMQLRDQMLSEGCVFKTESDTEVVLQWLIERGEKGIGNFAGMFDFAYWDKAAGNLILARDRAGIKPLYYYSDNNCFVFSTEVKAVAAVIPKEKLKVDPFSLRDTLSLGYAHGNSTMFQSIKTLPPGAVLTLTCQTGEFNIKHHTYLLDYLNKDYWFSRSKEREKNIFRELKKDLEESVQNHMVSDAPLGVICSGGVDSSLLAVIARKFNPDIQLFHASVEGPGSEQRHAQALASFIHAKLNVVKINRENFISNWVKAVYHNDFPSYHPNDIPMYLVCQLARDEGHKVVLSGEGADELFGGYEVNMELASRRFWAGWVQRVPKRIQYRLRGIAEGFFANQLGQSRDEMDTGGLSSVGRLSSVAIMELLLEGHGSRATLTEEILSRLNFLGKEEQVKAAYLMERFYGHLQTILMRNDKMGMMASIECRIPFLSNLLLEKWVGMPTSFKIKGKKAMGLKYMLKSLCAEYDLPESIWKRRKVGFGIPLKLYVKPNLKIFTQGFLEDQLGLHLSAKMVGQDIVTYYRLASIEIWGRMYVLRQSRQEVESLVAECQR